MPLVFHVDKLEREDIGETTVIQSGRDTTFSQQSDMEEVKDIRIKEEVEIINQGSEDESQVDDEGTIAGGAEPTGGSYRCF